MAQAAGHRKYVISHQMIAMASASPIMNPTAHKRVRRNRLAKLPIIAGGVYGRPW